MTEMRRLDQQAEGDLFERGRRSSLRTFELSREAFDAVQSRRPELMATSNSAVMLIAFKGSHGWLYYGFDNIESLRQEFRPTLERLVAALKPGEAQKGLYLELADQPNRPYIEPVLIDCLFALQYERLQMELIDLPDAPAPSDEVATGLVLRPARRDEYDGFSAVDSASFPEDPWQPADFDEAVDRMRVLEDRGSGRLAGYLILDEETGRIGKVRVIAVHPDYRRRGLGEAMMRWVLASFRRQGMRRASLAVRVDNPPAMALYRKLGFAPGRASVVYRRPVEKREIDAVLAKRKGTFVKFGGWR